MANVPSVDNTFPDTWTERDINLYNKLPFYLVKQQIQHRKDWTVWGRITGKVSWKPNMGDTMRAVRKEPSPHIRQFAVPQLLAQAAKFDMIDVRETKSDEQLRHHKFKSPVMQFLPSFQDFLTDHVDRCSQDIDEKIIRFDDIFQRGYIFYKSPRVYRCGAADLVVDAPTDFGSGTYKDAAWHQAQAGALGANGHLSFAQLSKVISTLENDFGVVPFRGGGVPGENIGYNNDKYLVVGSGEWWLSLLDDPWMLANKAIDLDVVFGPFKGSILGRITAMIDSKPLRFKEDGTYVAPELIEMNPDSPEYGQTRPNPDYTSIDTSPYEVAFAVGGDSAGYRSIMIGAEPKPFASAGLPNGFGKMNWNGKVIINRNLLLPTGDSDNPYETNSFGEYLNLQAHTTHGIVAFQHRNVMPIIFRRKKGIQDPSN